MEASNNTEPIARTHSRPIQRVTLTGSEPVDDVLAIEEPLAIDLSLLGSHPPIFNKTVSITMRTPGDDENLAVGFLYTEGILKTIADVKTIATAPNTVELLLQPYAEVDLQHLQRNFYTTSSCGICGKASIDNIRTAVPEHQHTAVDITIDGTVLYSLPHKLRSDQSLFAQTGGIHAVGLFSVAGELLSLYEDIGRHNALDKLIGEAVRQQLLPLSEHILVLSGRASFELIQKAAMAHIQIIAAVGAPSSLAVELAEEFGITLLGFVSDQRYNIYCGGHRIHQQLST